MESDFVTRNHIDSVTPFADPSISDLLLKYRIPPVEIKTPTTHAGLGQQDLAGHSNNASNVYISNMLGQLQGSIQSMMNNKEPQNLAGSGLQLNINSDILRWMIVLVFVIVLVIVIFRYMSYRRSITRNPLKKRLRRLENEMKAMRSRKNPVALEDSEADDDEIRF